MKKILLSVLAAALSLPAVADEGMWLLPLLQQQKFPEMQALGLDVKVLSENDEEIEIKESSEYDDDPRNLESIMDFETEIESEEQMLNSGFSEENADEDDFDADFGQQDDFEEDDFREE